MKIFKTIQVRELDRFTIENEPISSVDLMERASISLYNAFSKMFETDRPVCIIAGPGNNGGDALALARILLQSGYEADVHLISTGKISPDCETNLNRLRELFPEKISEQVSEFKIPGIRNNTVIVDGLFGSGLARPLTGVFARAVEWINSSVCTVVSLDIPSGLQGEEAGNVKNAIVKASVTFSLQFPKISFFFAENEKYTGKWSVVDIGIHPDAIKNTNTKYFTIEKTDILRILKTRATFSHKGIYGHLLLVSGSRGMAGASVLGAKAALRTGAGLVTVHGPKCNRNILQSTVPEAIFSSDNNKNFVSAVHDLQKYSAVAVGPGIGVNNLSAEMLAGLLKEIKKPSIFDADALNIFGLHPELQKLLPAGSIITPHKKEFERMFGPVSNAADELNLACEKASELNIIIILKGAYSRVILPNGYVYFNTTGNPGMATGGSGDVLTGIVGSLLAQGYSPENAAIAGVYLHGLAADLALNTESEESLIAGDITDKMGMAFRKIKIL